MQYQLKRTVSHPNSLVRYLFILFILSCSVAAFAQPSQEEDKLTSKLNFGSSLPAGILSQRSLVLYEIAYTDKELQDVQKYFQQAGIDAVAYMDVDYVLSGVETKRMFSNYFTNRVIKFLILLQKKNDQYQIVITEYTGTTSFGDKDHIAWTQSNASLHELMRTVYRFAISSETKKNFLISDVPETGIPLFFYRGKREERFPPDARQFKTAIPRFGNEADDKQLEAFLKENLPTKYDLVDPELSDAQLEEKGYRLVLRFIHTRGDVARDILGYDITQTATSLSTNYFDDGAAKIKTIRAKQMIYKFYLKNTEYGNIFLGSKWDADETWQDALKNHIRSLRSELKI
jgi:hypothetical protein